MVELGLRIKNIWKEEEGLWEWILKSTTILDKQISHIEKVAQTLSNNSI